LKADIRDILDELVPILSDRVYALLATPATGTDEAILQGNMKKGYLSFLQTIFTDELQDIFLSDRK
jgi:exportin-T